MGPEEGIYGDRVRDHTATPVNERIAARTRDNIRHFQGGQVTAISARLRELDREWDIDRALMLNFAVLGGTSFVLGRTRHPAWHGLLAVQLTFLAVHALLGWCPPVPVFRRLGFRTQKEIGVERRALLDALDRRLR